MELFVLFWLREFMKGSWQFLFVSAVIYDGCPKTITQGIWWPRTKFNLPAAVPCPKGSVGVYTHTSTHTHTQPDQSQSSVTCSRSKLWRVLLSPCPGAAIRHCDVERGWLEPDLYNCTSPPFVELSAAVRTVTRHMSHSTFNPRCGFSISYWCVCVCVYSWTLWSVTRRSWTPSWRRSSPISCVTSQRPRADSMATTCRSPSACCPASWPSRPSRAASGSRPLRMLILMRWNQRKENKTAFLFTFQQKDEQERWRSADGETKEMGSFALI